MESYVTPKLVDFLQARGLTLGQAKTRIIHVTEGFNFLGFTIRQQERKLLTNRYPLLANDAPEGCLAIQVWDATFYPRW